MKGWTSTKHKSKTFTGTHVRTAKTRKFVLTHTMKNGKNIKYTFNSHFAASREGWKRA